jgi:hypothetical protein
MTRKQYLILCKAKSAATRAEKEARRLQRINKDPDKQYDWDAWKTADGYSAGLRVAVGTLEDFIKSGSP